MPACLVQRSIVRLIWLTSIISLRLCVPKQYLAKLSLSYLMFCATSDVATAAEDASRRHRSATYSARSDGYRIHCLACHRSSKIGRPMTCYHSARGLELVSYKAEHLVCPRYIDGVFPGSFHECSILPTLCPSTKSAYRGNLSSYWQLILTEATGTWAASPKPSTAQFVEDVALFTFCSNSRVCTNYASAALQHNLDYP